DRPSVSHEESTHETRRLRQQWTEPLATALAAHAHVRRWVEVKVASGEVEDFLNACPRVVQHGEEDVIAFAVEAGSVDLCEEMPQFLLAQIAEDRAKRFLAGN